MFSVVIPTYRSLDKISEPINSLNAQTFKDFEVIFSDDCSPDFEQLKAKIKATAKFEYQIVQLSHHVNQVGGRKLGISKSMHEYVCLLDHDDGWAPEKLDIVRKQILTNKRPKSTIFYHQLICKGEDQRTFIYPKRGLGTNESVPEYLFFGNGMMQSSSLTFHKSVADTVYFDETSPPHDDWDLTIRADQAGIAFEFLEQPLAVWNIRRMAGKSERDSASVSMQWYKKHSSIFSARAQTAFIVNIILPKLVAEHRFAQACKLITHRTLMSPRLSLICAMQLMKRLNHKNRRTSV